MNNLMNNKMQKTASYENIYRKLSKMTFVEEAIYKFGEDKVSSFFARAWHKGHVNGIDEVKNNLIDIIEIANIAVK